jgi:hypothetical protein
MFGTAKSSLGETEVKAIGPIPRGFQAIARQRNEVCLLRGIKGLRERNTPPAVRRNEEEKGESRARKPRFQNGHENPNSDSVFHGQPADRGNARWKLSPRFGMCQQAAS